MLQFLGPIANIAGTWLKGRQKKAEIKQKLEVAREDCPDWLSWGILASIGASFGLKSIGQFKK